MNYRQLWLKEARCYYCSVKASGAAGTVVRGWEGKGERGGAGGSGAARLSKMGLKLPRESAFFIPGEATHLSYFSLL